MAGALKVMKYKLINNLCYYLRVLTTQLPTSKFG